MGANLDLRWGMCRAVNPDFQQYIRRYTSPNENFVYDYPYSNVLVQFPLKLNDCKLYVIQGAWKNNSSKTGI